MENQWRLLDEDKIESPSLIYYQDVIAANTRRALDMAGGAGRLWPHVKTHKMAQMVQYQQGLGIERFKCATLGEAEMLAKRCASHILLAYPLVGPNIERFVRLRLRYHSSSTFWATGDNLELLASLGRAGLGIGQPVNVLADVNMGANRTGVSPDALRDFCLRCSKLPGISLMGLHCYDGNLAVSSPSTRGRLVEEKLREILSIRAAIEDMGLPLPVMVMGGTPTFPCHAKLHDFYLSPGTLFVHDYGYELKFPDLGFTPGAALLTRVISRPAEELFTIDLGYKAISTDSQNGPGVIIGLPNAEPLQQSEEHWLFRLRNEAVPPIGAILYVMPTHICSTTALHPLVRSVRGGRVSGIWRVTARDRLTTF